MRQLASPIDSWQYRRHNRYTRRKGFDSGNTAPDKALQFVNIAR